MSAVAEADQASAECRQGKQTGCNGRALLQAGPTGYWKYERMSVSHRAYTERVCMRMYNMRKRAGVGSDMLGRSAFALECV